MGAPPRAWPCVGPNDAPAFHSVCVGTDVKHCAETPRSAGYLRHPEFRPGIYVHDLAIVFLETPATVAPARLRSAPVVATDGLRIVGFGRTDPEDGTSTGERRERSVPILARDGNRVRYPEATCTGDSGGGGFVDGELAAVTSSGPANCRDYGDSDLVYGERTFIDAALASRDLRAGCATARDDSGGGTALAASAVLLLLLLRRRVLAERARLEAKGTSISIEDGVIAATAYFANLTVVTANTKHFVPFVALRVVDWSQPSAAR